MTPKLTKTHNSQNAQCYPYEGTLVGLMYAPICASVHADRNWAKTFLGFPAGPWPGIKLMGWSITRCDVPTDIKRNIWRRGSHGFHNIFIIRPNARRSLRYIGDKLPKTPCLIRFTQSLLCWIRSNSYYLFSAKWSIYPYIFKVLSPHWDNLTIATVQV